MFSGRWVTMSRGARTVGRGQHVRKSQLTTMVKFACPVPGGRRSSRAARGRAPARGPAPGTGSRCWWRQPRPGSTCDVHTSLIMLLACMYICLVHIQTHGHTMTSTDTQFLTYISKHSILKSFTLRQCVLTLK